MPVSNLEFEHDDLIYVIVNPDYEPPTDATSTDPAYQATAGFDALYLKDDPEQVNLFPRKGWKFTPEMQALYLAALRAIVRDHTDDFAKSH